MKNIKINLMVILFLLYMTALGLLCFSKAQGEDRINTQSKRAGSKGKEIIGILRALALQLCRFGSAQITPQTQNLTKCLTAGISAATAVCGQKTGKQFCGDDVQTSGKNTRNSKKDKIADAEDQAGIDRLLIAHEQAVCPALNIEAGNHTDHTEQADEKPL